jgi:hypothetical protein
LASLSFPASASTPTSSGIEISGQIVTHMQVRSGSADYERGRQWMQASVKRTGRRVGSVPNLDADALGDVIYVDILRHTRSTGLSAMSGPSLPAPPWTPGFSGYSVGDTATVSTTSGGWPRTWSLELAMGTGGNLMRVTTDYHATRVRVAQPPRGH